MRKISALILVLAASLAASAQRAVMLDHDGNAISNNEFVDIRLANPNYPDATIKTTLADGTVEFRLQKIGQEGKTAPPFQIKTVDGKTISSNDLKGKVVVLNFWFIGCAACAAQRNLLNDFKCKFEGTDTVFIAATADASGEVKKYLAKNHFDYIQAADAKPLIDAFVSNPYPRNIVISRDGRIVYWRTVINAWDKFESLIRTELAK
jgi:peroxiredoxin